MTPASLSRKDNCSPPLLINKGKKRIIFFKRWIVESARKQRANVQHHHLKWTQRRKKKRGGDREKRHAGLAPLPVHCLCRVEHTPLLSQTSEEVLWELPQLWDKHHFMVMRNAVILFENEGSAQRRLWPCLEHAAGGDSHWEVANCLALARRSLRLAGELQLQQELGAIALVVHGTADLLAMVLPAWRRVEFPQVLCDQND